VVEGKGAVEK